MGKPEILFVGNYCRTDYLTMFNKALGSCHFTFLEYISPEEETNKAYLAYGNAVYWSQFRDVIQLLEKVKPTKVIFLFIESYNHVILNLACKRAAIPAFHLEHGLRADYLLNADLAARTKQDTPTWLKLLPKISLFKSRLQNRLFLKRSIACFKKNDQEFLQSYFDIRSRYSFLKTALKVKSLNRVAQAYISFSPKIFGIHKVVDHLPENYPVWFVGIPYFDTLAPVKSSTQERSILFIDQPLAEHRLLNWTSAYKREFTKQLVTIATACNYKLYVKAHPAQDLSLWQQHHNVEFVEDKQLGEISGHTPVVIGFYSTLLLPLAAMPHTTLITLENHPAGRLNVSKTFADAGVAHPVYSLDELPAALGNVVELHKKQLPNKKKFEEDWLYKFDGKAGERLRDILLNDEL